MMKFHSERTMQNLILPLACSALVACTTNIALAQNWTITNYESQRVRVQTLDGQTLSVQDLNGNPIATHPVLVPYLWSLGTLIIPRPTNNNFYVSRGTAGIALLSTEQPANSILPTLLELDGRWYSVTTVGFIQGIFTLGELSIAGGSYSNCRLANGQPLPAPGTARLQLTNNAGNQTVTLSSTEKIRVQYLATVDAIRVRSATGDVICDGAVASPIVPVDPIFLDGWEG
jgi:hypothetical protein